MQFDWHRKAQRILGNRKVPVEGWRVADDEGCGMRDGVEKSKFE